ncbi:hypothetical protein ACFL2H_07365 [Planctomycetota bacterium]
MIGNKSFQRKVLYVILIAGLLVPISLISRPDSRQPDGTIGGGGQLAQMRTKYSLSMADLGEIDPTSESMKLATLGMRGIAANLLWGRANAYKREGDWDNLAATLEQISNLQPRFISVWQFQGWNLAYNVSVEFDDYHTRYLWVKKGIDFLQKGVSKNEHEPVLYWELGWTFGHKIGRADEKVQYRRLFRKDDDFHESLADKVPMDVTRGPDNRPDNWLVGRQWFLRGQEEVDAGVAIKGMLVDDTSRIKRGKTPLIFHSHPPKWLMSYANAIEQEGYLGETAQIAWRDGGIKWNDYGNRELGSTRGFTIRLNDVETLQPEVDRLKAELFKFVGSLYEDLVEEKRAALPEADRIALETPAASRTDEQRSMAGSAKQKLEVTHEEVAKRAPVHVQARALRMARRLQNLEDRIEAANINRQQVAYTYWQFRCAVEQTDTAIAAHKHIYDADKAFENADLETMKEEYENAWVKWGEIFEQYPMLIETPDAEDLYEAIMRYRNVLEGVEVEFPPPGFKLEPIIQFYDETYIPVAKRKNSGQSQAPSEPTDSVNSSVEDSDEQDAIPTETADDSTSDNASTDATSADDSTADDDATDEAGQATDEKESTDDANSPSGDEDQPVEDEPTEDPGFEIPG